MSRFIDSLRELLLPAMALTILATLWVIATARNGEEDFARSRTLAAPVALFDKANAAADATDATGDSDADADRNATAQADTAHADHR